nr:transcription factor [Candidatus Freyarchaeota archaeon]
MTSSVKQETVSIPYKTLIGEEFDEDVLRVIEHLTFDYESTDEELASKTGMTVNEVRKTLYKLYDSRIATYHRVRDLNTSYFIHFWKLLPVKSSILAYRKKALLTIEKLKQRLEYERNNVFFHCGTKECPKLTFEEAAESKFKCPVCSNPLQALNNEKTIEFLRNKIEELEAEVENLSKKL